MTIINRPDPSEYAPYYSRYVDLVPHGDIVSLLSEQAQDTQSLLSSVDEVGAEYRYAPDKWSVKEVIGHIIDTERVFAFRAFAFSRNDKNLFPGMDQDDYMKGANYHQRQLGEILDEFGEVRQASITLFKSFTGEMTARKGTASGCEFSVRSLPFIIAGHELHHRKVLKERYLSADPG